MTKNTEQTNPGVDPITLEVVRNALVAYSNEMGSVLRKTAYNLMIYEVRDYCVGLVDPEGSIISQNTGGLPIFLADLGIAVVDGVERYGRDGFAPGDVVIMNSPYICGQHLNNVVIYVPLFYKGELLAFAATRAHWVDIGGSRIGFGSGGTTEIYEEGLQFRSLKIYKAGVPNADVMQIIEDNLRFPESALGDLRAQIASCRLGERRMTELFDKFGTATIQQCIKTIWNQSEMLARRRIKEIPDGVYEAESFMDDDSVEIGKPVPIKVKVIVDGDNLTVDFSEISEQVKGPINAGYSAGVAAARVAFKNITVPNSPVDEGCFRPLNVILPPGKLLNCRAPAAVGSWSMALPTTIDTILRALSAAIPDKIPAAHKGDMGGYTIHGTRPGERRRFVCMSITGGGWGGRPHEDGESAAVSVCQGDVRNAPIEIQEVKYPILFERHALRTDSGGPGQFRGGLGLEVRIKMLQVGFGNRHADRTKCPPWGLEGGQPGETNATVIYRQGAKEKTLKEKINSLALASGDSIEFLTAGGGGFGDPALRDANSVLEDVKNGYISIGQAKEAYGVEIDAATMRVSGKRS
jgi:N-methylhydantoinase B